MADGENTLFYGLLVWLLFVTSVFSVLPSNFALTQREIDQNELLEDLGSDGELSTRDYTSIGFFNKIARLMFAPFIIAGIPVFIATIIAFANYFAIVVTVVFVVDKLWIS